MALRVQTGRFDLAMMQPKRVYVDVVNYANLRFEAMAVQSFYEDQIQWWCPVCHEAVIAWCRPDDAVLSRSGHLNVEKNDECPICGCDVEVKIV